MGISEDKRRTLREFQVAAAICDPVIPLFWLLNALDVPAAEIDGWVDTVDEVFETYSESGIFLDLGFRHPGFPNAGLVYRFRNPLLPSAILLRHPVSIHIAEKILNALRQLLLRSRTGVEILLRIADAAGAKREVERYQNQLSWWISIEESEELIALVATRLTSGEISPDLVWEIVRQTQSAWPSSLRLSLAKAYALTPDGIPIGMTFEYFTTLSGLLLDTGNYQAALRAAEEAILGPIPEPRWHSILVQLSLAGESERERGHLADARVHQTNALDLASIHLPVDDPDTLTAMGNLASTLSAQGDQAGARVLNEQVLEARRRLLGEEHPATLTAMNNLASTLSAQGDQAGARVLNEQVLEARRRLLGEEHPATLTAMNNLASTLSAQGDQGGARVLNEQVLEARRRLLGEEHPATLTAIGNLAFTLSAQGDQAGARVLNEQVLEASRRLLGEEHPATLRAMGNLASTLSAQGDQAGARVLEEQVLEASRRLLGEEHPDTLRAMGNLASTLSAQGDQAGARVLAEQVLEARRRPARAAGTHS